MKNVIVTSILATVVSVTAFQATASTTLDAATERKLVSVCKAIQTGSRLQVHKALEATRIPYRNIVSDLRCNGMSAIDFAEQSNSADTAKYLAKWDDASNAELIARINN